MQPPHIVCLSHKQHSVRTFERPYYTILWSIGCNVTSYDLRVVLHYYILWSMGCNVIYIM